MPAPPSVSVLLPVRNGENYLASSISSVLKQDLDDFELTIVDDGSSDSTPSIIKQFQDSRIKYHRMDTGIGLFAALNFGFDAAKSSLVKIWAHDDLMKEDCLRQFVSFSANHPEAGMWYSDFVAIDAVGQPTESDRAFTTQRDCTPEIASPKLSALLFFLFGCLPGNISTVMLRREAWAAVGRFLTILQQAPDYEMWVRVSEKYPVGFIRAKTIFLREHPAQLGRLGQKQLSTIEEEFDVFKKLEDRLAGVLTPIEFWDYFARERGRQHIHWLARALMRGDTDAALRGLQAIRRYRHTSRQFAYWLFTINGRFFKENVSELFNAKATAALS